MERTLVVIKPDGVERNLIGEIIKRYENAGFKITALKMLDPKNFKEQVEKHYSMDDTEYLESLGKKGEKAGEKVDNYVDYGKQVVTWLRDYLAKGPIVLMIVEGPNVISKIREITGYTDPSAAEKGTIRGDFGDDNILKANSEKRANYNLVHASGNPEEAEREIKLWFGS